MGRIASSIMISLLFLSLFVLAFNVRMQAQSEEWVPYIPSPSQVSLSYGIEDGVSYVNVTILFGTSGYNVSDWGTPEISADSIVVNTQILQWTGEVLQVLTMAFHTYNLGNLSEGEYTFLFDVWGQPVQDTTFDVITPWTGHDVAITSVALSEAIIGQGSSLNATATVANLGDYTETFNATLYANATAIATQTSTLASGNSTTATFTWNTTGFASGNYTISANVTLTQGETNIWTGPFTYGIVTVTPAFLAVGAVGITGYKLVLMETMNNTLSTQATVNYYWSFTMNKWNGTQWISAGISGSSTPVAGYSIPALTTVTLPYYVYLLPSSGPNAVKWGDWLKVSFTFHWTYEGINYSADYTAELNVHPGDIAGAKLITLPYLGADGVVNLWDVTPIALNWQKKVPAGTDPTSVLARADVNGDGVVNLRDVTYIALCWLKIWTNTPPPG